MNENNHPRGFARVMGKTTALDDGNRELSGIRGVGEYPAAALSLAPLGSSRVARLRVPAKRVASARPQVRGKFIFVGDEKLYVRGVTYGTFTPDADGMPSTWLGRAVTSHATLKLADIRAETWRRLDAQAHRRSIQVKGRGP